MNKLALVIIVASIAASSLITYQIAKSNVGSLSDQYVKKEDLKAYFDQYVDSGAETIFAAVMKGVELKKQAEADQKRQAILDSKDALENDPNTPYTGNENGDVNIVMFSDYRCGYCKQSAPMLAQLLQNDGKLKLIIKEYPVLGQASVVSAKAALAAFKLDKSKYAEFNKQLLNKPISSEKDLIGIANASGYDGEVLLKEMAKPEYSQSLKDNRELGSRLGINGTPAFIIDGVLYPGAMSGTRLTDVINGVRQKRIADKST
jgi:protein-disulfide isomerase